MTSSKGSYATVFMLDSSFELSQFFMQSRPIGCDATILTYSTFFNICNSSLKKFITRYWL